MDNITPAEPAIETAVKPTQTPMYLGMILFLVSEVFLFGSLFWTYFYLRTDAPVWPPAGVHLDMTTAVINTAILLLSSGSVLWAGRAIRRDDQKGLARGLALTVVLGVAFLGITIFEWTRESFRPWTSAYGSIFYTMTGFHALHVLGGVLLMAALLGRTFKQRFSSTHSLAIEVGALYWHFVDMIWLVVFTTLFVIR